MDLPPRTSAQSLTRHFPGELVKQGTGPAWQDLLVEMHGRPGSGGVLFVPAVPEPQIVLLLEGEVLLEERELGGEWSQVRVKPGDMFLTTSDEPYEVRWENRGTGPFRNLQVFVGLPLLKEAARDLLGPEAETPSLSEFSGQRDETMLTLLQQLQGELEAPSVLYVQSLARCLAVHLVRTYRREQASKPRGGLTAFQLSKINALMEQHLDENLRLADLASEVGLSEFHFSRSFKKATGLSPTRYFTQKRMERARRLLLETDKTVLEVSLDVGYASASHFADVFRRATGITPTEYRG